MASILSRSQWVNSINMADEMNKSSGSHPLNDKKVSITRPCCTSISEIYFNDGHEGGPMGNNICLMAEMEVLLQRPNPK